MISKEEYVKTHVDISENKLELRELVELVRSDKAGAIATFIGTTRDSFEQKEVVSLYYEAYVPLALKSLHDISVQIAGKYQQIHGIAISHRIGLVPVGEESVIACISAKHRKEAFKACEELIDRLKEETAIWKLETYSDGTSNWKQNCECKEKKSRVSGK
jgi:molybdopterin synthase catalytic subunit